MGEECAFYESYNEIGYPFLRDPDWDCYAGMTKAESAAREEELTCT